MSNLFIKNAVILTVNAKNEVIKDGGVIITENKISHVGSMDKLEAFSAEADKELDATGMVLMPGLVNTHTHLSMTLFRGVADDVPGINWLPIIWSIEKNINADFCHSGALLGCLEMIKSGTTCFADQYWYMDRIVAAVKESGLRADLAQGILELNDPEKGARELKESVEFAEKWNNSVNGRITCRLGTHSIYTCSPSLLQQSRVAADEIGVGLHIHAAEAPNEPQMAKKKHGETTMTHLHNLGFLKNDVLAAHCVYVDENDMRIMRNTNTAVAHCPSAMMKYGNQIAPVPDLLAKKVTVGLGTDGCGSNNNLDMIEEMRIAALVHKMIKQDSTVLPIPQLIRMSTIQGAKALGLDKEVGSIEEGKKADLILFNYKQPHLVPTHHYPSHLVYSAFGSDVNTVIVDGQIIMKDRQVLTLDENRIFENTQIAFEQLLDIGGYTLSSEKNPKPNLKTNLTVKSFQTCLKVSDKIKRI